MGCQYPFSTGYRFISPIAETPRVEIISINLKTLMQPKEIVLLIHGTFAADREQRDSRVQWWQVGSEVCNKLKSMLPMGFGCSAKEKYSIGPATTLNLSESALVKTFWDGCSNWRIRINLIT
jgi:hypothetical protein